MRIKHKVNSGFLKFLAVLFVLLFFLSCDNEGIKPELDRDLYPGMVEGDLNNNIFSGYSYSAQDISGNHHYLQIAFDSLNDYYNVVWSLVFNRLKFNDKKQFINHKHYNHTDSLPTAGLYIVDYDVILSRYVIDTAEVNWLQFSSVDSVKNELIGEFKLHLLLEEGASHLPERLVFDCCTFQSKFIN